MYNAQATAERKRVCVREGSVDCEFVSGIRKRPVSANLVDARGRAAVAIQELEPRDAQARKFILWANDNVKDNTLKAESAKANTVKRLYQLLHTIYQKAVGDEDVHSLSRVAVAARILNRMIDSDRLLERGHYAKEPDIQRRQIDRKIQNAESIYRKIAETLADAPQRLGIPIPAFQP